MSWLDGQMKTPELIERLRRRYPANPPPMPGPWTVLVEYMGIDLLAFCAWSHASPARRSRGSKPIIGHELKVSRGDYRRELLKPDKRAKAVARCTEFYFVTPKGLLTDEEKAYHEPEYFRGEAFRRTPCPERDCQQPTKWDRNRHGQGILAGRAIQVPTELSGRACWIGWDPRLRHRARWLSAPGDHYVEQRRPLRLTEDLTVQPGQEWESEAGATNHYNRALIGELWAWRTCKRCEGRGYLRKSMVEQEAPTLWIPNDVGLIEVDGRGCSVVRKAPINHSPQGGWSIADIVRWVSIRPDPRHRT